MLGWLQQWRAVSSAKLRFYHLVPKHSPGLRRRRLYGGYAVLEVGLHFHFDSLRVTASQQRCPFNVVRESGDAYISLQRLNPDLYIWKIDSSAQLIQHVNLQTACCAAGIPFAYPLSSYLPRRRSARIILICVNCGGNDDN